MLEKLNLNKPEYRIREDCIKFKEKVYGINFNFEYHNIPTEFYSDFENLALMNDVFSKFKDIFDGQREQINKITFSNLEGKEKILWLNLKRT